MDDIEIKPGVVIPGHELTESHSRSGGPGGQHVNTTSTKITLRWSVAHSSIRQWARDRLLTALSSRLTQDGELVIHSAGHRSQLRNRQEARERLAATVAAALVVQRTRRPTRPTWGSQRRRVDGKKRQGDKKRGRGRVRDE